jgi:hypothetical protein
MGATMSINEIKPSEVRMDSKHIDKIILGSPNCLARVRMVGANTPVLLTYVVA